MKNLNLQPSFCHGQPRSYYKHPPKFSMGFKLGIFQKIMNKTSQTLFLRTAIGGLIMVIQITLVFVRQRKISHKNQFWWVAIISLEQSLQMVHSIDQTLFKEWSHWVDKITTSCIRMGAFLVSIQIQTFFNSLPFRDLNPQPLWYQADVLQNWKAWI